MRWRLDDVLAFLEVVDAGSITAAARRMDLSKSVVSKRITDLEHAVGAELFRRSVRRLQPTERGRTLYDQVKPLVHQLDAAVEEGAAPDGELRGGLRISAPMTFGTLHLGRILMRFAASHPRLEIALDLEDRTVDLAGEGYDLAVRIGQLGDSSLVARKLCTSRRVVCCSPDYARAHGLPRGIDEIAEHDGVDYAHVRASRLWRFETGGGKPRAVAPRGRIVTNNGEAMRDAAIEGLGLAMLPLFIAAEPLRAGTLIDALPGATPVPDGIHVVYPPTRHPQRKVRAVIDLLAGAFGSQPPWEQDLPAAPRVRGDRTRRSTRRD